MRQASADEPSWFETARDGVNSYTLIVARYLTRERGYKRAAAVIRSRLLVTQLFAFLLDAPDQGWELDDAVQDVLTDLWWAEPKT